MTDTQLQLGVYDMPADEYHADTSSLSSSGARLLLPPNCPAVFRYKQQNPDPPTATFDIGSAAHKLVLGTGAELVLVDRARWDTNAVKAELAEIRERGAIPLKRGPFEQVHAMAEALRAHPAAALFAPESGEPEKSLYWQDVTGTLLRARLDWLPRPTDNRRMIVADYKTTANADPAACMKAIADHGYHVQAAWYLDGVHTLGIADDAAFVFVFQEKNPPYLVTVVEPDPDALMWGRQLGDRAIHLYRRCTESGHWPGYADDVVLGELPRYTVHQYEAARDRGDLDVDLPVSA